MGGPPKTRVGLCLIIIPSTSVLSTAKRNSPVNNQCSPSGSANPGPMVSKALRALALRAQALRALAFSHVQAEVSSPSQVVAAHIH